METRKKTAGHRKSRAATQDVLGAGASPKGINPKWQKHYQRLIELRDGLSNRRVDLANDELSEQPTFSSHMADAGTDTNDRNLALTRLSSEQDSLHEISQRLDRVRTATSQVCEL